MCCNYNINIAEFREIVVRLMFCFIRRIETILKVVQLKVGKLLLLLLLQV